MSELHYPMSCPFCGGWPVLAPIGNRGECAARCQSCGARGPAKIIPGEAMEAWDTVCFRRRATDRDFDPPGDDGPDPSPSPVTPKLPEFA